MSNHKRRAPAPRFLSESTKIPRARINIGLATAVMVLVGATVVVLLFIQLNAPTTLAAQLQSYHVGADERQVLVTAVLTRADSIKSVSTKQDPTSVRVTVLVDRKRISPRSVVCGRVDCSREPV